MISDEAYSRILFDITALSALGIFHPYSRLAHTYSETTLTLGQRLGYLALTPGVPQPEAMRTALFHVLISSGLAMPDAVMQYALPDIDGLCIDVAAIQRRRDRMVAELQKQGYQLHVPQATFYLLPQAPRGDDRAFCALLAHQSVACSRVTSSNCPAISASPSQLPTTWPKKRSPFSLTRFSAPTRPCPPDPTIKQDKGMPLTTSCVVRRLSRLTTQCQDAVEPGLAEAG